MEKGVTGGLGWGIHEGQVNELWLALQKTGFPIVISIVIMVQKNVKYTLLDLMLCSLMRPMSSLLCICGYS